MSKNDRDVRYTLLESAWGQEDAERLSSHILIYEGYKSTDPTHPLGGPDGTKDLKCTKDGIQFVGGSFFPRGQQTFAQIKKKFLNDLTGVIKNNANGFVFITNQELSDTERKKLIGMASHTIHIFHLERIVNILNTPANYGIRLQYLDIEMTKEEMVAFMAMQTESIATIQRSVDELAKAYKNNSTNSNNPNSSLSYIGITQTSELSINAGDVYFAEVGDLTSKEYINLRPVVIVSNNINNRYSSTVTVVPITTQLSRTKLPTHVEVGRALNPYRDTVVLTEQIRTINKLRLRQYMTTLEKGFLEKILEALKVQLGMQ